MPKTYSRYDFMQKSKTSDEVTRDLYPDPLTIDYQNIEMNSTPLRDELSDEKISSFWHEAEKAYGAAIYDDIVLSLNGVPHKNLLKAGDTVYFPAVTDIESSFEGV